MGIDPLKTFTASRYTKQSRKGGSMMEEYSTTPNELASNKVVSGKDNSQIRKQKKAAKATYYDDKESMTNLR